jgi:hypothetical protein
MGMGDPMLDKRFLVQVLVQVLKIRTGSDPVLTY